MRVSLARYLIIMLLSLPLFSQSPYQEIYQKPFFKGQYPQKTPILFRAYPMYQGKGQYIVYIPVEISNRFFQFVIDGDQYTAGAELEAHFKNRKTGTVVSRIWQTTFSVADFDQTRDKRRVHFTADSAALPPGKYDILLKYRDQNGERAVAFRQKLTLAETSDFYASPPLFYYPHILTFQQNFIPITNYPSSLQMSWDFNRDMGLFLQAWRADTTVIPVKIELINAESGETTFLKDTTLSGSNPLASGKVVIPATLLYEGKYRLKTMYYFKGDSTRKIVPFDVVWFDKPISLWDYELAVKPLQYITDETEYKTLNDGNRKQRTQKLREFWEARDPTPGTPFNELKKEFYSRVDSSLARFSTKRRLGWQTDLGKVYISNGTPDKIDDHSLDPIPNPYMRWIYYGGGKEFVYTFRAVDGRKEYELIDSTERSL